MSFMVINLGRATGDDAGQWDQGAGNWNNLIAPAAGAAIAGYGAYGLYQGATAASAAGAGMSQTPWAFTPTGMGAQIGANFLLNERANSQNQQMAQNQMDFQENMSNTAHQREVSDLQKAGLNPTLSAGGNGASSPGGASATMQPLSMDAISPLIAMKQLEQGDQRIGIDQANSAINAANSKSQNELREAQKFLTNSKMPRARYMKEVDGLLEQMLQKVRPTPYKKTTPMGGMP